MIENRPNLALVRVSVPRDLPMLPRDRINILLITARPNKDDVDYRSISRPLVDLIRCEKLPASVQVLRPPTVNALRQHLEEKADHYHILHFDGHGGYGDRTSGAKQGRGDNHEGRLLFENADGSPAPVAASDLATMLSNCTIPFVVLNACRSALIDAQAAEGSAFASVAGALVKAGFRGVLAMAYNLTVTGAQQFLPAFYRRLFKEGNLLEAACEGRRQMFENPARSAWNPEVSFQDWLLPVVYQQADDFDLSFASNATQAEGAIDLPEEAVVADPLGFVGRDSAIHGIERVLRQPTAGILVHGLGGVGKTTLARQLLQWLRETGGLMHRPHWFSFDGIHSASFVLNQIGRDLLGNHFDSCRLEHLAVLTQELREKIALLLVWDNFESVRGFESEYVGGLLAPEDQDRLRDFLGALRGGKTKVLITSRSDEAWLSETHCSRLRLDGLCGDDLWEYAARVLDELALPVDRKDAEVRELLKELAGHPVLIRAVLPELKSQTAGALRKQWQANLPRFVGQVADPAHARLLATLDLAGASFTAADRPYLIPLSFHALFVDVDYLHLMGANGVSDYEKNRMERILARLARAGLLSGLGQNVFRMHPLLTSYLRNRELAESSAPPSAAFDAWRHAFVDIMGRLAQGCARKELHEQRGSLHCHYANFHRALELAEASHMQDHSIALAQTLAGYALNTRNWSEATRLFEHLAKQARETADPEGEAIAYHSLGLVAQGQRDRGSTERWFLKALDIQEQHNDDHTAAAETYHHLGIAAQEYEDFSGAEELFRKAADISERRGDRTGEAAAYHHLGRVYELDKKPEVAEYWYRRSLGVKEVQGAVTSKAFTYHGLGIVAQMQGKFDEAKEWFGKSLAIRKAHGDQHEASKTYHHLGMVAQEQKNFEAAEESYLTAATLAEKHNDTYGAAGTYAQLGRLGQLRGDQLQAGAFYLKAFLIFSRLGDGPSADLAVSGFARTFRAAPAVSRERLRALGRNALGDEAMQRIAEGDEA